MQQKTTLPDLAGGLNKDRPAHRLEMNELAECNNVVYRNGIWTIRPGYTTPYTAVTGTHAITEVTDHVQQDETVRLLAGTVDGIEEFNGTGWTNRLNLGSTRTTSDKWSFCEIFDRVYAVNGTDSVYNSTTAGFSAVSWDTSTDGGGTSGLDITTAEVVIGMNNRLILLNVDDTTDGHIGNKMEWTEVNDNNRVETPNQLILDASQTPIIAGGVLLNNLIAVYQEDIVTLVQNQGNPVFAPKLRFEPGIIGKNAWTFIPGGGHFYVSHTGFHMFAGGFPQAVGEAKVTSYFFDQLDRSEQKHVYCWTDWENREIHIHYPDSSATAGKPNRKLVFNWQYNVWSEADFEAYCGFYRFRDQTATAIFFGDDAGVAKLGGGADDAGSTITTKIRTKALSNAGTQDEGRHPDYMQINRIKTDALPITATVKAGAADYGRETPTFTSATVTATDGYAPYADVVPTYTRYASVEVESFSTLSELLIEWTSGGDE